MPAALLLFLLVHLVARRDAGRVPPTIGFIPGDEPLLAELTDYLGDWP